MLERQIMFKKLQELQRKKKLQELNDSRPQSVMESLMHNNQSSGALYGLTNTGIPVRDPSQMFIFGDTKFVQGFSNRLVYSQTQTHVLPSMGQYFQSQGPPHESSGFFEPVFSRGLDIGRVSYDSGVPQTALLSQLNSAFGNHKSHLQDVSPDIVTRNKASSWLKNLEASKTEQTPMNDAKIGNNMAHIMAGSSHRNLERSSPLIQVASNDQCRSSGPITVTNDVARISSSSIYSQHLDMANQNMVVLKSKKRKLPTFEHLPWHKEVTGGCSRFHDMSTAELDWTRSANRLPEKLKEDKVHWKRRLSLTTQLMQLLFLPPPAIILSGYATAHCDTVAYYAANLALGDACSLASRSYRHQDIPGLPSGKCMPSKSSNDQRLSETVEGFIDRSNSLEEDLSRLEKGESSILDLKVEFLELEKFSVISRFAVFHSRGSPDTASSGGASAMPKMYPQRYVKAKAMPSTVPEGHGCLSL